MGGDEGEGGGVSIPILVMTIREGEGGTVLAEGGGVPLSLSLPEGGHGVLVF